MEKEYAWLFQLKKDTPSFLQALQGKKRSGFFHYSQSGDYLGEHVKWGLGNASFFLKIVYTLNLHEQHKKEVDETVRFIQSFQKTSGIFEDSLLRHLSLPIRFYRAITSFRFNALSYKETQRAETRQALSALALFNKKSQYAWTQFPQSTEDINDFFNALDWTVPWHAASHVSHILFFFEHSQLNNKAELIEYTIALLQEKQQNDGAWYEGNPSLQQKINGAMKVITGLKAVRQVHFAHAEALIDLCLSAQHDAQACDNFNIVYVLKYADEMCQHSHRHDEIVSFMKARLAIYKEYYHEKKHGFSFHKNGANRLYYGALVSRGKNEPDIHGTVLFLWGISLIAQVIGIEKELGFQEFIA